MCIYVLILGRVCASVARREQEKSLPLTIRTDWSQWKSSMSERDSFGVTASMLFKILEEVSDCLLRRDQKSII